MTAPRVSVDEASILTGIGEACERAAAACERIAQNDYRIDGRFLPDGNDLIATAVLIRDLYAEFHRVTSERETAMAADEAAALADDLIACAAPYDNRLAWRDRDFDAFNAARDAIIAALTGRAVGGAE